MSTTAEATSYTAADLAGLSQAINDHDTAPAPEVVAPVKEPEDGEVGADVPEAEDGEVGAETESEGETEGDEVPDPTASAKESKAVPSWRLKEEADKRRAAELELEEWRTGKRRPEAAPVAQTQAAPQEMPSDQEIGQWAVANVPAVKEAAQRLAQIKADALDDSKYPTNAAYLEALSDAQSDYKMELRDATREVKGAIAEQQRQVASKAAESQNETAKAVEGYHAKLKTSDIPKAAVYGERLDKILSQPNAPRIHPTILSAIVHSDDPAATTAAIMSSTKTFQYLVDASKTPGKEFAAIAKLGELSAAYRASIKGASTEPGEEAPRAPKAPSTPNVPRSSGGQQTNAYWQKMADEDPVKYNKLLIAGKAPDLFQLR